MGFTPLHAIRNGLGLPVEAPAAAVEDALLRGQRQTDGQLGLAALP